jgi:hypothetical protein
MENYVLPEKNRKSEMKWEGAPSLGVFKVTHEVTIPALNKTSTFTKTVIIIPLFLVVIILLILAVLVLKIVLVIKKRTAKK